jgi:hypothetical protein
VPEVGTGDELARSVVLSSGRHISSSSPVRPASNIHPHTPLYRQPDAYSPTQLAHASSKASWAAIAGLRAGHIRPLALLPCSTCHHARIWTHELRRPSVTILSSFVLPSMTAFENMAWFDLAALAGGWPAGRWEGPLPLAKLDPPAPFRVGLTSETDGRRSEGGMDDEGPGEAVGRAC